jgi:membrane protein
MDAIARRIELWLWPDVAPLTKLHARGLVFARYVYALLRDFAQGELSLRAMSLVYTTMLAIVPLLAFIFAVLKGLGFHRELEPLLREFLAPIGPARATELTASIIGFVDNISGTVLASVSVGLLLFTALTMAQKVEASFNFVWRVDRPRSFARRFTEYLSMMVGVPFVMLFAMGLIATLSSTTLAGQLRAIDPIGAWLARLSDFTPYFFVIALFSFLYMFIPNARVHFRPALIGGLFAGVAWVAGGRLFAEFVVSASTYTAIYAGFAILFFLMLWMYLSWLILLIGAQLAFYVQNPAYLRHGQRTAVMSNALRERLALSTMLLVGRDFEAPSHGWRPESLAARIRVPRHFLEPVIGALKDEGLLTETVEQRLMPARDPRRISLAEVLGAVRSEARDRARAKGQSWNATVELLTQRIETSIASALEGKTLADLVDRDLAETAQALAREESKGIAAKAAPTAAPTKK